MKRFLLLIVFFISVSNAIGQDIHFSQFYAAPLTLNPANTGNYTGDWRIMNSYRQQWKSIGTPFLTNAIAYDRQFYIYNENISGGIIFVSDKSGDAQLKVNKIFLSGAYHKALKGHVLHAGYQLGFVQKSFNTDALTFPDQYDNEIGKYNSQMPTTEVLKSEQLTYLDMNAGLAWGKQFRGFSLEAGLALFHFNRPKESFFSNENNLVTRKILTAGGSVDITKRIFINPNLLLMGTTGATDYVVGANVGYRLLANKMKIKSVFAGILTRDGIDRNKDALAAVAGVNFKGLDIGVSYDYNISDLYVASGYLGGLEISIIYTSLSTVLQKVAIPCDRY